MSSAIVAIKPESFGDLRAANLVCTCLSLDRIEIFDLHTQSDGVESRRCTDFARQPCFAQVLPFQSSRHNANHSIVSGEPPKHPVFSKVTGTICDMTCELINAGNVFEKHLLESYLAENQTDPVTNEPATVEDYIELKGSPILSRPLGLHRSSRHCAPSSCKFNFPAIVITSLSIGMGCNCS